MSGVNYAKVATDESGSTAAGQSNGPLATPPLMKRPYVWGGLLFVVIAAGVLLTSGAAPTPAPAPAADAPPATLRGGAAYPATYSAAASAAAPYASTYSAPRAAPYTAPYTAPYSAPNAAPYAAPSAPYAAPHAPPDSPHAAPASDSAFAALFAENAALRSALAAKPAAADFDIGAYRAERLAATPPNIIECAAATAGASQEACHLSNEKRFQAVGQKGITLWMTGLSGSGKSTIARALEEALVLRYGKHVQMLDGDNVRTGLNRDLGFSPADRAESVRRVGETACLFNGGGVITLVTLVSPYRADRDAARKRHQDQGLAFMEVFMNVPLEIVQDRDPKGLYAKVAAGELKGFTGVDAPYEVPLHADIDLPNWELSLDECVRVLLDKLHVAGVLQGGSTDPSGLPLPPGFVDAWIEDQLILTGKEAYDGRLEAAELPMALLTDIDVNWLHVISEGWAAPLRGFMRQGVLLQSLHFNSVLIDPYDSRGKVNEEATDWESEAHLKQRASLAVPIVLPITAGTRDAILKSGKSAVALVDKDGRILGRLHAPETYPNRKEEIVSRCFGAVDAGHPYISHIYEGGDWLLGGEIELFDKIKYHDGLDEWRLTPKELFGEFKKKGADVVFAFQTRNPTHAGHAYLMRTGRDRLVAKGFKQPVLWLSPLGGWTKSDDVPLDVRVRQHQAVLDEGMLDAKWTVMGIWPAPMIYGGPTEVQFHAASRRAAGASFFVVGRDAAGIKGSDAAVSHADDDMYDANHARFVLQESPVLDDGVMQLLSFDKFFYDKTDHTMKALEASRVDDFISISGSKMRALAAQGAVPCTDPIPNDLLAHNCVPQ
ncbi:Adenylylsulfate kinase-domain-containing protein, partial [Pelagophyceae sp. CCMP2097]